MVVQYWYLQCMCFIKLRQCKDGLERILEKSMSFKRKAALAAWRIKRFGGDFDPVRAVVEDAVAAFSRRQPKADRALWLKVANVIGWERFQEIYHEQLSIMEDCKRRGNPLRNPAAAFHRRLQCLRSTGGAA